MKILGKIFWILVLAIGLAGCTVSYSTTGASLNAGEKTISVAYFPNRAPIVNPTLSQEFTEKLKDKFISQTSLNMVNSDGDLLFEGEITGYDTKPIAITNNQTDQASLNRLTITIKVKFINQKAPKNSFDSQQFMAYLDYSSDKGLDAVEGELVPEIIDKIIEDIFNKSVVNW